MKEILAIQKRIQEQIRYSSGLLDCSGRQDVKAHTEGFIGGLRYAEELIEETIQNILEYDEEQQD